MCCATSAVIVSELRRVQFFQNCTGEGKSIAADFEAEGYTFEIGGKNKSRRQIANLDPSKAYVVKDDIEHAALHNIPLWMFGFLY